MSDENVLPPFLEPEVLPKTAPESDRGWAGTTSLILGLVNLIAWCLPICGAPLALIGIVLGIVGLKSTNRGISITGIVLNAIGLILSILWTILFFALLGSNWFQNFDPGLWYWQ